MILKGTKNRLYNKEANIMQNANKNRQASGSLSSPRTEPEVEAINNHSNTNEI